MAVGQQIALGTLCGRATVLCRHTRVAVWPPVTRVSRDTRDTRVAVLCRRSGQEILDPREFMKRARDEMGAQSVEAHRAATRFDVHAGTVDHNRASEPHLQTTFSAPGARSRVR